jgi:hypothetical protein
MWLARLSVEVFKLVGSGRQRIAVVAAESSYGGYELQSAAMRLRQTESVHTVLLQARTVSAYLSKSRSRVTAMPDQTLTKNDGPFQPASITRL